MNKNTSITLTLFLIIISSYFLYWQGEKALERAAEKFTVLAFENTDLSCNENSLEFFIENKQEEETSYQIKIAINNKSLEELEINIPAKSKELIKPKSETIKNICEQAIEKKYAVSVSSQSSELSIYKLISIQSHE